MNLVYKNEKTLFTILLLISSLVWLAIVVGTFGAALIYLLFFFIFYCFAQSALISYLKGTGVKISESQFPDLKQRIDACCAKLDLPVVPEAYLLHMGGAFNAFATRFLGKNFIVLYSDIVDALEDNPDALNFYIGHEIGHIKRHHLRWAPVLMPASVLPLLGAAYSRAREYTCDRHGFAACDNLNSAQFGLAALAAGGKRWRTMSKSNYILQARETGGFWMSLHELTSDYPWLVKRMAAVKALAGGHEMKQPKRNPLAVLLALFIPRFGMGGGLAGVTIIVAVIGILAAVALPAYQDYTARAKIAEAVAIGQQSSIAVADFYYAKGAIPESLEQAGASSTPASASVPRASVDPRNGVVRVITSAAPYAGKAIVFIPSFDADKKIVWKCSSDSIPSKVLPADCRGN